MLLAYFFKRTFIGIWYILYDRDETYSIFRSNKTENIFKQNFNQTQNSLSKWINRGI